MLNTSSQCRAAASEVARERALKLQAAVVRVSKAARAITRAQLLDGVVTAVRPWFVPSATAIAQAIDVVVERGFVMRAESKFTFVLD